MPAVPSFSVNRSTAVAAVVTAALAAGLLVTTSASADAAGVRIHDIQGTTRVSPLAGQAVADVPGIVTGVRTSGSKGFWFQDPHPDADPATSEGVFVFTSSAPTVAVGDAVTVSATVDEYVPGGASSGNQSVTELGKPTVTVVSHGNAVPAAVVIDSRSVPGAFAPAGDKAAGGSINGLTLRPKKYALDLYESLEGMNVRIGTSRVTGATDAYHELWVTVKPNERPTPRGGTLYNSYTSQNTGRLMIQSLAPAAAGAFPVANVGDSLTGTTEGPLDYNQYAGTYTVAARQLGTVKAGRTEPEVTRKQKKDELAVATYNVENLDPTDPQSKFDKLAAGIVDHLASPDIVAIEEVQDNDGAKNDGVVAADVTVGKFIDAIVAAGGPRYAWRSIDPVDLADGGEPGGNIRQGFLYNPDRVGFTDRAGGTATNATDVVSKSGKPALTYSPGRIDPADPAWNNSRKPLAGEFTFRGKQVFLVANHFGSKGGDQALDSQYQPPTRSSETARHEQAKAVNSFVKKIRSVQKNAEVVVLGDLNDFEFSDTAKILTDGKVLSATAYSLPKNERYSYVYQGNSQILDQILVSPAVKDYNLDIVHINAEFADQNSDHDPSVIRFRP
ncbi:endonuclease/exonuclease/phosphatase family protein [Streptomyces sp. NBC_01500]|uniref:endonuclease/exonuclease/phosphatase family protein n=1 Tax=Streptomyces sp. NBC_01500 TaxID=2903886 RepID=UPI00224D53A4|nr:endonuclease/exonuclease/phosphatase family protein [Streptomyces sp. NBC_01500]MCX4551824.1 endonuclease/exonuclease/phosphatase family protein [Streptomyces sp. NBC_01500]